MTRRQAFRHLANWCAASPLALAQRRDPGGEPFVPPRFPPLAEMVNPVQFEDAARSRLAPALFDHLASGSGSGRTLRRNRTVLEQIFFRPHFLVDVSKMDLSTEVLGQALFTPILAAPLSHLDQFHPTGAGGFLEGAAKTKTIAALSWRNTQPLEAPAGSPVWFQIDGAAATDSALVESLKPKGVKAIVVSAGYTEEIAFDSDRHSSLAVTPSFASSPPFHWPVLEGLIRRAGLPVLVKGVLDAASARAAISHGAAGLIVSNYGGRTVDGLPSPIEVLSAVAEAAGSIPVLADSGFRRGHDILKALALGARAVFIGRPALWAFAAYGPAGVEKVFRLFQAELALSMGLSGRPNLAAVGKDLVHLPKHYR